MADKLSVSASPIKVLLPRIAVGLLKVDDE